jgi:probable HAF family extracellular repeat protein
MRDLGTLGGTSSWAYGINDQGEIVGESDTATGLRQAFVVRAGEMISLGTLAGMSSGAYGINNLGDVVGASALPGGQSVQAVLWHDGEPRLLGTLGANSYALSVNDRGEVVGESELVPGHKVAFLWRDGQMISLGELHDGQGTGQQSSASSINNRGQIVGSSPAGLLGVALLFRDGEVIDLNTRIPADAGWELNHALGINDAGQIVGGGVHGGASRAFLLTPVDPLPPLPPMLRLERRGNQLALQWQAGTTGFRLQYTLSSSWGAADWVYQADPPELVGDRWEVVVPISGERRFYRLEWSP